MTLNEVFEIFKTLSLTSQLWPQKPEALFTEYFFHFADFPFHFAGDLFCCPRSCKLRFPMAFPVSSLTLPATSFAVPFTLSVVLEFIMLIRCACRLRLGLFRVL